MRLVPSWPKGQYRLGQALEANGHLVAAAAAFYSADQRAAGGIEGKDRDGNPRVFQLLGCSVAVLELPPGKKVSPEAIGAAIAALKSDAKAAPRGIARALH